MMLTVQTGLNSQSAAISQTPSSPVGPAMQEEEKKKQSHIPTVEVSAAQAQNFSARVGEFLINQTNRSANTTGSSADALAPTGADGAAPAPAVSLETPPPAAADHDGSSTDGEPDDGGWALRGENVDLTADVSGDERVAYLSSDDFGLEEDVSEAEGEEDATYSASLQPARSPLDDLPPVPPPNAGTIVNTNQIPLPASEPEDEEADFSEQQRDGSSEESVEQAEEASGSSKRGSLPNEAPAVRAVSSGDFSLYFDEAGTYQFAAA